MHLPSAINNKEVFESREIEIRLDKRTYIV